MVTNLLGRMMTKANVVGLVQVFCPIDGGPSIPFIQFADDLLFMLKAEVDCVGESEVHFINHGGGNGVESELEQIFFESGGVDLKYS